MSNASEPEPTIEWECRNCEARFEVDGITVPMTCSECKTNSRFLTQCCECGVYKNLGSEIVCSDCFDDKVNDGS